MAEASWPDTTHNNRAVTDIEYEQLMGSALAEGFVGSPYDPAPAYGDGSGMVVKLRANRYALVRGHVWSSGTTDVVNTIAANSSGSTRYDLLVLGLNRSNWTVRAYVKNNGGTNVYQLTRQTGTTGVFEIPVAVITVRSGASVINAGDVASVAYFVQPPPVVSTRGNSGWVPTAPGRALFETDYNAGYTYGSGLGWDQTLTWSSGMHLIASKTINGYAYQNDWNWKQFMSLTYNALAGHSYAVVFDCQFYTGDSRAPLETLVQIYDNGHSICHSGGGAVYLPRSGSSYHAHIEGQVANASGGTHTLTVYAARWTGTANFDIGPVNNGGVPTWLRVYDLGTNAL